MAQQPDGHESTITPDVSSEVTPQQALVESCLEVIEERRKGQINSAKATLRLLKLLPDEDQADAFERYVDELNEIERDHAIAEYCGRTSQPQAADGDEGGPSNPDSGNRLTDDNEHSRTDACGGGTKRSADAAFRSGEGTSARKQADESMFPWRKLTYIKESLDPSVALTLELKKNYLRDLKGAKNDIISNPHCPDFPDGLWTDVLAGHFVDLDKVFSGYYSLESDYHHTQSIGDVDITVNSGSGASKPSKIVRTHGEWAIAFGAMRRATLFAYPHRAKELDEYERFIVGQFGALGEGQHQRVLNLDRAIQLRASRTCQLLLTDFSKFTDLTTNHLIGPSGAGSTPQKGNKRGKSAPGPDAPICRRWNNGRCSSDGCNYKHICLTCNGKHQARSCGGGKAVDGGK